jgi:hypothetical protein
MKRSLALGMLTALLVAGCGSASSKSADDLADAIGCDLTKAPATSNGNEAGVCRLDGALVSIYTFPSQDNRDALLGQVGATPGLSFVVGDKWAIMCDTEQASTVADATDGDVR